MTLQRIMNCLGYAGLLPFVIPTVMIAIDSHYAPHLKELVELYSFGIVCFLTGSWWGLGLTTGSRGALILSNLIFLLAFFFYLYKTDAWALVAALILIVMFLYEQRISQLMKLPSSYRIMRATLTLVASVSMLAIYFVS